VAFDQSGTANLAANQVVVRSTVVEDTQEIVSAFLNERARLIAKNQPSPERRIDRLNGNDANNGGVSGFGLAAVDGAIPFALVLDEGSAQFSYSLRRSQAPAADAQYSVDAISLFGHFGLRPEATVAPESSRQDAVGPGHGGGHSDRPIADEGPPGDGEFGTRDLEPPSGVFAAANGRFPDVVEGEAPVRRFDIWAEGRFSRFSASSGKGDFFIAHAGADYLVTPDLPVGIGAQIDWTDYNATTVGTADGLGFMAGPYATARLASNLYVDASLSWGLSDNRVSPYGTYEDSFSAGRWRASAALFGAFEHEALLIRPDSNCPGSQSKAKPAPTASTM